MVIYQGQYTVVFGLGDPSADLVVAYQVPGFRSNRAAQPYEGPAGEMLEKMLMHVLGLGRDRVYLLGVGDCHPRDGQSPPRTELAACRASIRQQLDATRPKAMLVFGGVAFRTLFDEPASALHRARGSWRELGGVEVMPTYHPAHLLRQPSEKRAVFQDLKTLRTRYDALGGRH
jgi:DNA polymerase